MWVFCFIEVKFQSGAKFSFRFKKLSALECAIYRGKLQGFEQNTTGTNIFVRFSQVLALEHVHFRQVFLYFHIDGSDCSACKFGGARGMFAWILRNEKHKQEQSRIGHKFPKGSVSPSCMSNAQTLFYPGAYLGGGGDTSPVLQNKSIYEYHLP